MIQVAIISNTLQLLKAHIDLQKERKQEESYKKDNFALDEAL